MAEAKKINQVAWSVARRALEMGDWAYSEGPVDTRWVVDLANLTVVSLADKGCLSDAFGSAGSLEVELAPGFVAKNSIMQALANGTSIMWFSDEIFDHVRKLDANGLLTPEDRAKARTFAFDEEVAAEKRRKAAEAERERKRRELQEHQERVARAEAAKKRLAEIEAEKAAKEVK